MKNILEALKYMHEHHVVHRDLKPENLILASKQNDYDICIADFGLASFIKKGEIIYDRKCQKKLYLNCEFFRIILL